LTIKTLKLAGIYTLEEHRRAYPKSALAANLLGYVSLDGEGLGGAERSFDRYVHGRAGKVTLLRDARRGMYLVGGEGKNKPVDGTHVILTIDEVVQYMAERALQKAVEQYGALAGSAIVMDPRDGSILAMASYPSFDPNHFRDFTPAAWRNRGVQDLYEPGSTFKIVTASAGLEEGIVTPSQIIDCGAGSIEIARVTMHEHGGNKYGLMPFEDVIAKSSNVGTIKVGLALGPRRFFHYITRFGFGQRTGVELPGEAVGILRKTEQWSQLSNAAMAIGQEIGVTPLQILTATATVANGGKRVHPHILDRVVNAEGETLFRPTLPAAEQVISPKTAAVLNEILKVVVSRGTGQNAALPEHVVAGKTGTAQKAGRGGYGERVVASFTGYVPADRPRLAILVVVDEPRTSQYGGTVAAPAFREIAEGTLRYLGIAPSLPGRTLQLNEPKLAIFKPGSPASQAALVGSTVSAETGAAVLHMGAAIGESGRSAHTQQGDGIVAGQRVAAGLLPVTRPEIVLPIAPGETSR